jgi:hypothetical protein
MPLPAPTIQIRPPGLLSLLGLQNGGVTPVTLGNMTVPTFELSDWYLRAKREMLVSTALNVPTGAVATYSPLVGFTVPNNEWWWVENYSLSLQTAAGDTISAGWSLGFQSQSIIAAVGDQQVAVAPSLAAWVNAHDPFWMGPGATLGVCWSQTVSVGPAVAIGRLMFSRLQV